MTLNFAAFDLRERNISYKKMIKNKCTTLKFNLRINNQTKNIFAKLSMVKYKILQVGLLVVN